MRLLLVFSAVVAVTVAKECGEAVSRANFGVKTTYSTKPNNGKYASGTTVNFKCDYGLSVKGSKEAKCVDGEWQPREDARTRRCPYMCQLSQLKQRGYKQYWVEDANRSQDWFPHGTKANALCYKNVSDMPIYAPPNLVCVDGGWQPITGKGNCFQGK